MAVSGLCDRKVLVGTGRAISIDFSIMRLESGFVGPPFPAYMAAMAGCHFSGDFIGSLLIVGRG